MHIYRDEFKFLYMNVYPFVLGIINKGAEIASGTIGGQSVLSS
jgi:hypothetical protein